MESNSVRGCERKIIGKEKNGKCKKIKNRNVEINCQTLTDHYNSTAVKMKCFKWDFMKSRVTVRKYNDYQFNGLD